MGIHDRDWYREEVRKREGRAPAAPPRPTYSAYTQRPAAPPRPAPVPTTQDRDAWSRLIPRVICQTLAVYGFLQLVKNYLIPLL